MIKVLIADDEKKIREMIGKYVEHEGYQAFLACDGKQALDIYKKENIDVVILDVMMPNMDGYEAFKKMCEIKPTHCIFLTALSEEYNKIYGFDIGGEDYVTKPFSLKELMMRIKVVLKRENKDITKIVVDGLIIDESAHIVYVDDKKVDLANKEFELLLFLAKNRGKVVSRDSIFSNVWGYMHDGDDRTLDTHMKLLRKDIGKYSKYITTIRGVGYRFEKEI